MPAGTYAECDRTYRCRPWDRDLPGDRVGLYQGRNRNKAHNRSGCLCNLCMCAQQGT